MKYDIHNSQIGALSAERRLSDAVDSAAAGLAAAVRAAAPVETGMFKRSVSADGNRVISTDPFAHLVEFGSMHNPPYAPFRRGARAAGLRLDESQQ